MGEVGDEFAIEVSEPGERVDTLDRCGGFPVLNSGEFDLVHLDSSSSNDHS